MISCTDSNAVFSFRMTSYNCLSPHSSSETYVPLFITSLLHYYDSIVFLFIISRTTKPASRIFHCAKLALNSLPPTLRATEHTPKVTRAAQ